MSEQQLAAQRGGLRPPAAWSRDRDDLLGRIYQVLDITRLALAAYTVVINLAVVAPRAHADLGVIAVTLVLLGWQIFVSLYLRCPSRWTKAMMITDTMVTAVIVWATAFLAAPADAPLSLAGYWIIGCGTYAAMFFGTVHGVSAAGLVCLALLTLPGLELRRIGLAFVTLVLTVSFGVMFRQFRATIEEQERERVLAAALAERERLSRIVHDGALQVLALVEREGPSLGPRGVRLASLARESEAQLRTLLQDRDVSRMDRTPTVDLAARLDKYASARVTVSTMASLVMVPRALAEDVEATLDEILKNVDSHAGPEAQAWVLLDQEADDEVILWVRDDGVGMSAQQVAAAAKAGRMGIRDSIVGRMAALGGSAILKSSPGAGTEWELRFPTDMEVHDG